MVASTLPLTPRSCTIASTAASICRCCSKRGIATSSWEKAVAVCWRANDRTDALLMMVSDKMAAPGLPACRPVDRNTACTPKQCEDGTRGGRLAANSSRLIENTI
eukprot:scaffold32638_cov112-Isochrysis_galbana.AAC.5